MAKSKKYIRARAIKQFIHHVCDRKKFVQDENSQPPPPSPFSNGRPLKSSANPKSAAANICEFFGVF